MLGIIPRKDCRQVDAKEHTTDWFAPGLIVKKILEYDCYQIYINSFFVYNNL